MVEAGESRLFTIWQRRCQSAYLARFDRSRSSLIRSTWAGRRGRVELHRERNLAVLVMLCQTSFLSNTLPPLTKSPKGHFLHLAINLLT